MNRKEKLAFEKARQTMTEMQNEKKRKRTTARS